MNAVGLLERLQHHPVLCYMTLDGIITFSRLVGHLKRDILQPQPIQESNPNKAPPKLPQPIAIFLSLSLGIPFDAIGDCWEILGDYAWELPLMTLLVDDYELFKHYGWKHGLTALSLYPPSDCCENRSCMNYQRIPLKREYQKQIVVYTQPVGVQPAYRVHLYCPKCKTSYHTNYSVFEGRRTYYAGIPDFIQVGEHQYVETKLVYNWRGNMLYGWFSATNTSRVYSSTMTDHAYFRPYEWGLSNRLTTNHIWDAFVILSLLEDAIFQQKLLVIPHTGSQSIRFKQAMAERNKWIVENGQPDAVRHECNDCVRIFLMPGGTYRKCQAIVGDGLSIGRPCCGFFRCTLPLESNRDRFCATHNNYHDLCAIDFCGRPVAKIETLDAKGKPKTIKKKACDLPAHQKIEAKNKERSTGSFLYRQRLQHASISQPVDAFSSKRRVPANDVQENIEVYTVEGENVVRAEYENNPGSVGVVDDDEEWPGCPSKSPTGNHSGKVKARFGRRRTHNEQTLVRPCGVIFARATMFGAEAVSNFLVMVKNAFSVPGAQKPEHIFYDTNCDARQQAEKDPWFHGIGMCVDAWHFRNKHAVTHQYCQLNCNPAMYPELMDDAGGWFFNTSIAEQTNAWLGGYHSMCREMLPDKYDFFLDEMIRLRNVEVIKRLHRKGRCPRTY